MGVKRNTSGPLQHAELIQFGETDGVVFWDRTVPPPVDALTTDGDYIIEIGDRHDLLAFREMGNSQHGWIIMERGHDIDPEEIDMRLWPNDYVPGRSIKIPNEVSIAQRGISN